jgi:hypothetical protein
MGLPRFERAGEFGIYFVKKGKPRCRKSNERLRRSLNQPSLEDENRRLTGVSGEDDVSDPGGVGRGSQYTSWDYRARLAQAGITVGMSRKGDCYDNAMMESFFSSFKSECIEGRIYQSRSQARQAIFEYLETFYNRQRLHSSLEYQSPVPFEQQNT